MAADDLQSEGESLLRQVDQPGDPAQGRAAAEAIDAFLERAETGAVAPGLVADLMCAKARIWAAGGRPDDAVGVLDRVIQRFGYETDLGVARSVAFALLLKSSILIDAGRVPESRAAAERLVSVFAAAPDDQNLTGFGLMVLDVAFLLLAREQPDAVLALCGPVVDRLAGASEPSRRAVAAGAVFLRMQALSRLGRLEEAHADVGILRGMGEPALAALDRVAARFGPEQANPIWHAQIVIHRAQILSGLGRGEEAHTVIAYARRRMEDYDLPEELLEGLRGLEDELSAGE